MEKQLLNHQRIIYPEKKYEKDYLYDDTEYKKKLY